MLNRCLSQFSLHRTVCHRIAAFFMAATMMRKNRVSLTIVSYGSAVSTEHRSIGSSRPCIYLMLDSCKTRLHDDSDESNL